MSAQKQEQTKHSSPAIANTPIVNDTPAAPAIISEDQHQESNEEHSINPAEDKDITIKAPTSILIVGATGLVGLRLIRYVQRIATEEQTVYVLTRRHLFRQVEGVIVKVAEAATWPSEIASIPNLTTVYSALGARPVNRFANPEWSPSPDEFYLVNHNLTYQIAVAAKDAGVTNFIYISHFFNSYPVPRLFFRRTKMRNATEKDLENIGFDRLLIIRPGPLAGVREKTGSLKGFSFYSILDSLMTIATEPLYLIDPIAPLNTFNFAASVAKTAAIRMTDETSRPVEIVYPFEIWLGAYEYNLMTFNNSLDMVSKALEEFQNDRLFVLADMSEVPEISAA